MKKILLSLTFISVSIFALAQTARQSGPPDAGSFYVTKSTDKGLERISVTYSLSTAPFVNTLNMYLSIWEPMMLSAQIMNDNSEMVLNWMPSQKSKQYNERFDISNLRTGKYHIELYGPEGNKVYTIDFEKQAASPNPTSSSSR